MDESDQTLRCVINSSMDTDVTGVSKRGEVVSPLALRVNPAIAIKQSTCELLKEEEGKGDSVEFLVAEGKVLFIPQTKSFEQL